MSSPQTLPKKEKEKLLKNPLIIYSISKTAKNLQKRQQSTPKMARTIESNNFRTKNLKSLELPSPLKAIILTSKKDDLSDDDNKLSTEFGKLEKIKNLERKSSKEKVTKSENSYFLSNTFSNINLSNPLIPRKKSCGNISQHTTLTSFTFKTLKSMIKNESNALQNNNTKHRLRSYTEDECWNLPSTSSSNSLAASPISANKKFIVPLNVGNSNKLNGSSLTLSLTSTKKRIAVVKNSISKFSPIVKSAIIQRRVQKLTNEMTNKILPPPPSKSAKINNIALPIQPPIIKNNSHRLSNTKSGTISSQLLNRSQSVICRQSQTSLASNKIITDVHHRYYKIFRILFFIFLLFFIYKMT